MQDMIGARRIDATEVRQPGHKATNMLEHDSRQAAMAHLRRRIVRPRRCDRRWKSRLRPRRGMTPAGALGGLCKHRPFCFHPSRGGNMQCRNPGSSQGFSDFQSDAFPANSRIGWFVKRSARRLPVFVDTGIATVCVWAPTISGFLDWPCVHLSRFEVLPMP